MQDEIMILDKQLEEIASIFNAIPGEVFRLKESDTLLILQRRMSASDLLTALTSYNEIFSKTGGALQADICQSVTAYVRIKTLVEGKAVDFDARLIRQLIKEYKSQMTKVNNIIHLSKVNAMAAEEYQKERIKLTLGKNEAFLECFEKEIAALEKQIERMPVSEETAAEAKPEKKIVKKKDPEKPKKSIFSKMEEAFSSRKNQKEIEEQLKTEEKKKSFTKCVEIPFYDRTLAFTEVFSCKDIPAYSLLKRKNNVYFGLSKNIGKGSYDNTDQTLLELTEATENFIQFMTVDLLAGEYELKPFTKEEKSALQMYFNFVSGCFENNIGLILTVQEYLAFKSYYNKVVLTMFDLEEKFRTDYYRALVIADSYCSYMSCYDLSYLDESKVIVKNIMNEKYRNYVDDLELIINNHMVDADARERVQELILRMKTFHEELKEEEKEPEPEAVEEIKQEEKQVVSHPVQPVVERQWIQQPAMIPFSIPMGMNQGTMQVVIQILNQNMEVLDEALYAGNNIKQALYDFETRDASIKRLGLRNNGTDVFCTEEIKQAERNR